MIYLRNVFMTRASETMTDSPKTDKLGTLSVSVRWAAQNVLTDLENEVGSNCWPETTAKAIVELEEYLSRTNTPDTLLPLDELAWLFHNNKEYSSDSTIESIQKLFNALHRSRRARKLQLAREVSNEPTQSLSELLVSVNAMLANPSSDGGKWKVKTRSSEKNSTTLLFLVCGHSVKQSSLSLMMTISTVPPIRF